MKRTFIHLQSAVIAVLLAASACSSPRGGDGSANACARENGGCDPHAMCANNNGVAVCTCSSGYAGNGYQCVDIDECGDHTAYCDPHATCTNGAGTYTCTCNAGWTGDGNTCTADDAGPVADDAGATFDAGGSPADSGPGLDAGPTVDAGQTVLDAGEMDSGAPDAGGFIDAGPEIDAGTPYDAGPITIASDLISGQIQIDPSELQWRGQLSTWTPPGPCENGQAADGTTYNPDAGSFPSTPPCLAGEAVQIVDQVRQSEGGGPLGSGGVTDWTGAFQASHVDLVDTDLGLLAVVTDPAGLMAPSAGIVALPPFSSDGVSATPTYVVSVAFMQHIATVIGMSYESMMTKGVALIHVTGTPGGQPVFNMYNLPEGSIDPGWYGGNVYLEYLDPDSADPPYVYYLSSNLDGVLAYNSADVPATSSAGLVVVVQPAALLYPPDAGTYETAYTVNASGEDSFAVFGGQPNVVVDVSIPSD